MEDYVDPENEYNEKAYFKYEAVFFIRHEGIVNTFSTTTYRCSKNPNGPHVSELPSDCYLLERSAYPTSVGVDVTRGGVNFDVASHKCYPEMVEEWLKEHHKGNMELVQYDKEPKK